MAKKSKATKKVKRSNNFDFSAASISAAAAIIFAGVLVILFGNLQDLSSLKLLMVGFGSALLVFGGAMLAIATNTK